MKMNSKVKILSLDDDIHDVIFVTSNFYIGDSKDFILELLKSHTIEYEVRSVYLLDLEKNDEEESFDYLFSSRRNPSRDYNSYFNKLWKVSKKYA